jgi:NADPH:quinone reductase-like Zn-dependent oxidoreductase
MPNVVSGTVREVGEGFIVLGVGTRVIVGSQVRPEGLAQGVRVVVSAWLRGAEWVAQDVQVAL